MKIFISYAHVDEYRVREMVDILRDAGHDPWFDHRLVVARPWEEQLYEAIQACERFLYALTPESVASKWCQWEFAQAAHMGKPVIPVLMQGGTKLGVLGKLQFADFSKGPTPRGVARLTAGINAAQCIPVEWVSEILVPHDDDPERPVEKAPLQSLAAQGFFERACTAMDNNDHATARIWLLACLDLMPDYAAAKALLRQLERRSDVEPADMSRLGGGKSIHNEYDLLSGSSISIDTEGETLFKLTKEQSSRESVIPSSLVSSSIQEYEQINVGYYGITMSPKQLELSTFSAHSAVNGVYSSATLLIFNNTNTQFILVSAAIDRDSINFHIPDDVQVEVQNPEIIQLADSALPAQLIMPPNTTLELSVKQASSDLIGGPLPQPFILISPHQEIQCSKVIFL